MAKTLEQLAEEFREAEKALKLAEAATERATKKWDRAIAGKEAMHLDDADEKLRKAARKGAGIHEAALVYRDAKKAHAKLGSEKLKRQWDEAWKAMDEAEDRVESLAEAMQRLAMRL